MKTSARRALRRKAIESALERFGDIEGLTAHELRHGLAMRAWARANGLPLALLSDDEAREVDEMATGMIVTSRQVTDGWLRWAVALVADLRDRVAAGVTADDIGAASKRPIDMSKGPAWGEQMPAVLRCLPARPPTYRRAEVL